MNVERKGIVSKVVCHIAGKKVDGVQQCTRCLRIMVDSRHSGISRWLDFSWPEGSSVWRHNGIWYSYTTYFIGNPEIVDCIPMEDAFEEEVLI